jgi:hypothetical protein
MNARADYSNFRTFGGSTSEENRLTR